MRWAEGQVGAPLHMGFDVVPMRLQHAAMTKGESEKKRAIGGSPET